MLNTYVKILNGWSIIYAFISISIWIKSTFCRHLITENSISLRRICGSLITSENLWSTLCALGKPCAIRLDSVMCQYSNNNKTEENMTNFYISHAQIVSRLVNLWSTTNIIRKIMQFISYTFHFGSWNTILNFPNFFLT